MHRHVHADPLIGPSGQDRPKRQVARGGDRQELGDALDQGQHDDVEKAHRVTHRVRAQSYCNRRAKQLESTVEQPGGRYSHLDRSFHTIYISYTDFYRLQKWTDFLVS